MGLAMLLQPQCSIYSLCLPHRFGQTPITPSPPLSFHAFHWSGFKSPCFRLLPKNQRMVISAVDQRSSSLGSERKRKVVEHVCLLKAKEDLSDEEERDMLDYLYTTQYQMGGIVAISLGFWLPRRQQHFSYDNPVAPVGRVSAPNPEHYTHALYMRFQRKENLAKFYENPFYLKVLKEHVLTYCHGLINVDYEAEVEDDMFSIFRKGEDFNHGVEFVLLMSFNDGASGNLVEHALASLALMALESPSLVVQFTQGLSFSSNSKEYTYGVVIRFRSVEAFEIFMGSKEYKDVWLSKFQPIVQKSLSLHFSVDPVGTEIM